MSLLIDLQHDLQDASAAVAHAERTAILHPNLPSVMATLRTIQGRRNALEEQFAAAANDAGLDICSYRVEFENPHDATIANLTAALGGFQKVFTTVYDALVNGPKKRARISDDVSDATAFGFGYTFPGSVGFMMTLSNERMLLGTTKLDSAMEKTLELISTRNPEGVQEITETVGIAAVRVAHQWAADNAKARFGADIAWQRETSLKSRLRIQPQEVAQVADAFGSAIAKEQVRVTAELLIVNYEDRTFEMRDGDTVVKGTFGKAISPDKPAHVPKKYIATLTVSTKIALVDGKEDVSYFLVSLEDLPAPPLAALAAS
jgi:hypothetical protein